jgi:hypothetical protein
VLDPATKKEIAALEVKGVDDGLRGKGLTNFLLQLGGELFVGVEREDPIAGALGEGEVFLRREAGPGALEDFGVRSVEPESTMTIWSAQATLPRVRARFSASLKVTIATDKRGIVDVRFCEEVLKG